MKRSIIILLIIMSLFIITGCGKRKEEPRLNKNNIENNQHPSEKVKFNKEVTVGHATYKVPESISYGAFKDQGVNVLITVENYTTETVAKDYNKYYVEDKNINGYDFKYYIDDSLKQYYNTYIYKYILSENDRYIIRYTPYSTKYDLSQIDEFIKTFTFQVDETDN